MPPNDPRPGETWRRRADGALFTVTNRWPCANTTRPAIVDDAVTLRESAGDQTWPMLLPVVIRSCEFVSGASDE